MNIEVSKPKFGRGGKRNRQRRARMARRGNVIMTVMTQHSFIDIPVDMDQKLIDANVQVDLSVPWNEEIAKKAFDLWGNSGKTQKVFAEEHGFPVSRFRSWKSKIAA